MVKGVQKTGVLKGVLYIPELKRNLFSIGQATENGLAFFSTRDRCELRTDADNRKVVMEGKRTGKLYSLMIHVDPVVQSYVNNVHTEVKTIQKIPLKVWHARMAHINEATIKSMKDADCLRHFEVSDAKDHTDKVCSGCMLGKQHQKSYTVNPDKIRSQIPGELVHGDICDAGQKSIGGARYFLLFKDDCTGYRYVYFLKKKLEALQHSRHLVLTIERDTGNKLMKFRSDRGGQFMSSDFETFLLEQKIARQTSAPYTPQQNGFIERDNRTMVEAARSMLHAKGLPLRLWAEAVNWAVHVLNRTFNSRCKDKTPFERIFGMKPSVDHYRIFGCKAYLFVRDGVRSKLDAKSKETILVGYSNSSKAYQLWEPQTNKVQESSDVVFDEGASIDLTHITEEETESTITVSDHLFGAVAEQLPLEAEQLNVDVRSPADGIQVVNSTHDTLESIPDWHEDYAHVGRRREISGSHTDCEQLSVGDNEIDNMLSDTVSVHSDDSN